MIVKTNAIRFLLIIFFIIGVLYVSYNLIQRENENIKIDEYNFEQLENTKKILNTIGENNTKYYSLKEFNELYKVNIKPIRNCYYVSNNNGKESYIFGFLLYSYKYKQIYGSDNYAYPRYDLEVIEFCGGDIHCKDDMNLNRFRYTISNPCEE